MRLFAGIFLILISCSLYAQTWTWTHAPKAGENVMVTLSDAPDAEGLYVVYFGFEGTKLVAYDATLIPTDAMYTYTIPLVIHDHMNWVSVVLKEEDGTIVSSDFQTVLNPNARPEAAKIEQALAANWYSRSTNFKAEPMAIVSMYREAIAVHPAWLQEPDVLANYYSAAKKANATDDLAKIKAFVESQAKSSAKPSEALLVNSVRTAKDMGDSTLMKTLRKKLDKSYPKSSLTQGELLTSFDKATSLDEKIKIREQFISRYPITKDNMLMLDQMTSTIAELYGEQENWKTMTVYIDQIKNPTTKANVANNYAWTLVGEGLNKEAIDLETAAHLSHGSLEALKADIPPGIGRTKKEMENNLQFSKAMFGDTYAVVLYKQGKYKEALDYQEMAVKAYDFSDGEMNERYAIYLDKTGNQAEMARFVDEMIVKGGATSAMKDLHKTYWTKTATQENLYNQYVAELDLKAENMRKAELQKKWQDLPTAKFSLKDLNGQTVSLDDYKGKIVVLDFWATWCGPCKASFPGMKMAVEHYASDPNVVFLFIDTWEGGENAEAKVSDFIKSNNYPFHVVMDSQNKVVVDYKVDGIPTKFIIGPDQKIRFTSVGFSGSNDQLVDELKTMIQLIRENSPMQKS